MGLNLAMKRVLITLSKIGGQDLDRESANYWAIYEIDSKSEPLVARKNKEQKVKGKKRRIAAPGNRRKRPCVIFRFYDGTPLENVCKQEICGILQPHSTEGETFLVHPKTGKRLFL